MSMKHKVLLCLALVLGGGLIGCSTASRHSSAIAQETMTASDWSDPVNGLRGRLIFGKDEKFNGTRLATIYIELQNVSNVLNPIEIYYDTGRALPCVLLDVSNQPVAQSGMPADIISLNAFWIVLPYDSILRFRVSVTGYGIPKDAGLSIGLMSGNWIIPPTSHTDHFLSASFVVAPPANTEHIHAWRGVLKLPIVKIPADTH